MKLLLATILVVVTFVIPAWSQTPGDSSGAKPDTVAQSGKLFVDENGDGIDDNLHTKGNGMKRGKDRFIDKDGDGICDGRESGLGFRAGRNDGGAGKGDGRQGRGGKR
ncbi:MAG: hypothetical protein OEM41_02805 [Ignavibacteria bacterium]|nr:hypothetical protein [Ignavibacteria bacterium]